MTSIAQLSSLKSFLEAQATIMRKIHPNTNWKYGGHEELVLDCGSFMEAKPLPVDVRHGSPKKCYWNCHKLTLKREDLTYVEGFAIASQVPMPVAHAWLLTAEGEAIDPTWKVPGVVYLGVALSTAWIKEFLDSRKEVTKTEDFSIFSGNHLEGYSLLKQGLPSAAYPTHTAYSRSL